MNMKILTFGQNCNFPGENIDEFNDEKDENELVDNNNKKSIFIYWNLFYNLKNI